MNTSRINYAKIRLDHYVEKIRNGRLSSSTFEDVGYEVLRLLFAYKRHEHGLHLRWQRAESNHLALLTVQELKDSKKRDPILNGIYEAILLKADGNEAQVQKLLETAGLRINEISSSQRAKAVGPRQPNPVLDRVAQHIKRNPDYEPREIIELLMNDIGNYGITDYDEELQNFYYVFNNKRNREQEESISLGSVRNAITKLKK